MAKEEKWPEMVSVSPGTFYPDVNALDLQVAYLRGISPKYLNKTKWKWPVLKHKIEKKKLQSMRFIKTHSDAQ